MHVKNFVRKAPSCMAAVLVGLTMLLLLLFPGRYAKCALDGLSLWAVTVLPAALPFLFLGSLFTGLSVFPALSRALSPLFGKVFRVSGAGGCAALLSAVSGYPVGAKTVWELSSRKEAGRDELFRVAAISTTSGPAFLVGAVGAGMFRSPAVGWVLLLCHLLGVWGVGFMLGRRASPPAPVRPIRPSVSLGEALSGAVTSVLCVGGAIALFSVFGQMACDLLFVPLPPAAEGILRGLLEMTTGCALLSDTLSPQSVAACCFLVTFGGLCVLAQQLAFLSKAGVKTLPFIGIKLAQALLASALCYVLCLLLF